MNRMNHLPTLKIDVTQKISFIYKGKKYMGAKGDTIATALFANGVRIFSRSLKYHRPRGLYSLDGECSNTMMEVDGIPNVRCENTFLKEGMVIEEQNVKGSAENDMLGFLDKLDWLMPAGFYYDVMHKPAKLWPIAMKQIRKAAGIGKINPDFKMPGKFDEIFPNTDVCVIGGGPAGMTAALSAAKKGLRVILMESRPWLGGCFEFRSKAYQNGLSLHERAQQLSKEVASFENIRVFTHTSVVGTYNNNLVTGFQIGKEKDAFTERYIEIRAKSVVAATGCIERPLIFDNNERPGVMQTGCALRLAKTYGQLPGKKAVFSIGHDFGLEAALELHDLGLSIACIADIREDGQDPELLKTVADKNILLLKGWVAVKAHGRKRVKQVSLSTLDGMITRKFTCDLLVASAGMTPVTGAITVAQGKLKYDNHTGFFLPDVLPEKMHAAGRVVGLEDPLAIEASGTLAGLKAAFDCETCSIQDIGQAKKDLENLPGPVRGTKLVTAPVKGRKSFICFDEDATIKNIKQAIDKGFDVPELIKRFTATGLGPGQGGIPGHNL
ncbi:MAG: FAD-dependent oxidoreductase, partial [Desulfobacula sp.]